MEEADSTNDTPSISTIEEVQDGVDALMLAIFEAVRGHDKTEEERAKLIAGISSAYAAAVGSVERLDCVDAPRAELLSRIASVQAEYCRHREAALGLEARLRTLLGRTEARVEELVLQPSEAPSSSS